MPRTARKTAESGIYHVMLRGINRQNIFEEPEDYRKMIWILGRIKEKSGFELYAYCLMSNHMHLLIKEVKEPIGESVRRVADKYVYWFNIKYERTGHLFQDRFKSEPVEDDSYFLTVLRYIHYNPIKAGLAASPRDYEYSSYTEYEWPAGLIDTGYALGMLPGDGFRTYHEEGCEDRCLDMNEAPRPRYTEEKAEAIMRRVTGCGSTAAFQELSREQRDMHLIRLKEKGLSIRQISRLTGETYYIIQKAGTDEE